MSVFTTGAHGSYKVFNLLPLNRPVAVQGKNERLLRGPLDRSVAMVDLRRTPRMEFPLEVE